MRRVGRDHRFKYGDTIRVGPIALTAHVTGGHTRGCTSWSFPVRDGDRMLNVVRASSTPRATARISTRPRRNSVAGARIDALKVRLKPDTTTEVDAHECRRAKDGTGTGL